MVPSKQPLTYPELAAQATGTDPHPFQQRLADEGLPDVLRVPTGTGKTLAAVLPWLYRRRYHPDADVRAGTPRWLVFVLPQRALVEQTVEAVKGWLHNLESDVGLHTLMGGEDTEHREWKTRPEQDRIFVGTQDMVLSRLLMRGFAEFRGSWPMTFGLLHAGVQFVFDEVQLMGPGLPTSLQLQGLRDALGTAAPCRTMWMSATLDPTALSTVDFRGPLSVVELDEADRSGPLLTRLRATRSVNEIDLGADAKTYARTLAGHVVAEHRPGTRTLVVVNTVDRAVEIHDALARQQPDADLVLLHSRFRPADRRARTIEALAEPGEHGIIVVSTQVLEAGVDVTSETLITELAPWTSIVQRAGRCNRDGMARGARLFWTRPPAAPPYDADELAHTAEVLAGLQNRAVTSRDLAAAASELTTPNRPVLRRRDLTDLFDTAPDLSGNDIDVSAFIRDTTDHTSTVAWRSFDAFDEAAPQRDELCPAPISDVKKMINQRNGRGKIFDQKSGQWRVAQAEDVRPSAVIVLDAARGGYLPERGFAPGNSTPVEPVAVEQVTPDAVETDPHSVGAGEWISLTEHLGDVEREARSLLTALGALDGLQQGHLDAVVAAATYHDLGKAHPTFLRSLEKANTGQPPPPGGGPWAKSPSSAPLRHDPPHFRHELVSALLLLDPSTGLLDGIAEPDLVTYLVLAHHGKVRLSARGHSDEPENRVLGVDDGETTMDAHLPDGRTIAARALDLGPVRLGAGSLTSRALRLRDRTDLGPFRLAFLEAIVRAADWRASESYRREGR
jgi:CRISPR-associated endonuclease/helicase Cas3